MRGVSPIPPLRALAERTITVSDLVTDPIWKVKADAPASETAAELAALNFDIAALANTPIQRFVVQAELSTCAGSTADVGHLIDASVIVSRALPVAELVARLAVTEHVFVMDDDQIRWLVTRADLQAPVIGMATFACLLAFEAALAGLVPEILGDRFIEHLPSRRRSQIERLFAKKRLANAETTLGNCLNLGDWLRLASGSPDVRRALGRPAEADFEELVRGFNDVRNDLAHAADILNNRTPLEAAAVFGRIQHAVELAWTTFDSIDGRWDLYAATEVIDANEQPWTGIGAVELGAVRWHILTAANPRSAIRPDDVNAMANAHLGEVLERRDLEPLRITGSSPDAAWKEESFAVSGLTRSEACELAYRFGQAAIFELDDDESFAVPMAPPCVDAPGGNLPCQWGWIRCLSDFDASRRGTSYDTGGGGHGAFRR